MMWLIRKIRWFFVSRAQERELQIALNRALDDRSVTYEDLMRDAAKLSARMRQ